MRHLSNALSKGFLYAVLALSAPAIARAEGPLTIHVFNPGGKSLFPVTSTLVTGAREAVLIDAQFQRDDAHAVLKMIQDNGKDLKTIYISHGDPDFYFGLDVIVAAYPNAKIVASPLTADHIKKTIERKVEYWGPILGENAPHESIVPEVIEGDTLSVDGETIKIVGLDGHDLKHTFVWIPSIKTVAGGVVVFEGVHVWMADSQTLESRDKWRKTLDSILALSPERIIPGHVIGKSKQNEGAINFTRAYVAAFEEEAAKAGNSAELIEAMKFRYPDFQNLSDLELSAKVIMGEMQWP